MPQSTLEGRPYEEGQDAPLVGADSADLNANKRQPNGELWRPEDESFYNPENQSASSLSSRWRYPTNFQDAAANPSSKGGKKKKEKKDRWARTEDAYSLSEEQSKKKKSKRRKSRTSVATDDSSRNSTVEFPEDPEGGLYQSKSHAPNLATAVGSNGSAAPMQTTDDDVFAHQF